MSDDIQYYQQRALVERSRARSAPTHRIAAVHEELAALYEEFIRVAVSRGDTADSCALPLLQKHRQAQSGSSPLRSVLP